MNAIPPTKNAVEIIVNAYITAGDKAKNLGFSGAANIQYAMAMGYLSGAIDLKAIDHDTYNRLMDSITTRLLMPLLKKETLDLFANTPA